MENTNTLGVNRAKPWQIALFPFNNAATNVYFAFYTYFTYFALMYLTGSTAAAIGGTVVSAGLALAVSTFNGLFAPLMRIFDGITDPLIGGLMDRTKTKIGKFRPFMIIGNVVLALSVILMMLVFRPIQTAWLRWVCFIVCYIIYILGYTCQCAVTKAGQTCLTNDPKQRSQFVVWNMIGQIGSIVLINVLAGGILTQESLCAKGLLITEVAEDGYSLEQLTAIFAEKGYEYSDILATLDATKLYTYSRGAGYGPDFYNIMVPVVVALSGAYTVMAVAAIWNKDRPEFWGVSEKPAKLKDYVGIIKGNKEIRWLMLSSGLNKLASTVATSVPVACLLYGCLMGDYNGLYIPFYALCFVFMGIFFLWGSNTAGKKGQKRGVAQFTLFALFFYIGVLIMLCIYNHDDPSTYLTLFSMEGGFHLTINAYTIFFIILYGCGYGAFNCCDQLTIPMVADCTDYETYRSGNYVPGIMGTIFSLVDKIISSLQTLLLTLLIVNVVPGLNMLPVEETQYMPGMEISTILCFCVLPMLAWLVTVFCMTRYKLSGKKLQEIQAVNAVRKAAVQGGMSMEQAMETWKTIDQVPAAFIPVKKLRINKKTGEVIVEKENFLDKAYNKIFTRREVITDAPPSSNAIDIPEEYLTEEVKAQLVAAAEEAAKNENSAATETVADSATDSATDSAATLATSADTADTATDAARSSDKNKDKREEK